MINTTVREVREAFPALSRMFEEVKMGQKAAWDVSRLLGKMKPVVRDFERAQVKLYREAGGQQGSGGVILTGIERRKGEEDEEWQVRKDAFRETVNRLHDEVDALDEQEISIELQPIKLSAMPKKRKNERGEDVDVEYRATDLAAAGPFIVDDSEKKE